MVGGVLVLLAGGAAMAADTDRTQPSGNSDVDRVKSTEMGTSSDKTNSADSSKMDKVKQTGSAAANKMQGKEADTLTALHRINQEEITLGKLAQDKSDTDAVKSYGQHLVSDHQDADKQVSALARKHDVDLSSAEPDQSKVNQLQGLSGAAFDRKFAEMMVRGHAQAISLVTRARAQASDGELKEMLDGLLPKLQEHLRMAKDLTSAPEKAMGRRPSTRQR